jgi:hypothetical protein
MRKGVINNSKVIRHCIDSIFDTKKNNNKLIK